MTGDLCQISFSGMESKDGEFRGERNVKDTPRTVKPQGIEKQEQLEENL